MTKHSSKTTKILLIGWDSADWKVIHPLMDAGEMPHLQRLVEEGVMGNLATLHPDLSPMLWTSIATGKRPFKHGIWGFTEPDPHGRGIRPVSGLSRKTKAVWNILSQKGMKCNVVGWWPSHPAESINGVMVSNLYKGTYPPLDQPWPMPPGAVHPERLVQNLADLRWHPQKLEAGHILPFVPQAAKIDQDKDHRLESIAKIICDCSTLQAAAMALMFHEPWNFTAVYFDAIDHFSHGFMHYHPPRQPWIPEQDYEIYNHVVSAGYIYHDMLLGRLMKQAGDEATVILVSDHGFQSDHLRPKHIPKEPAGPAVQHRTFGIVAMKGPGIKKDRIVFGASLLDICPTILALLGLPVGRDMDGRPLTDAFEKAPAIRTIDTWDRVPGNDGMHPPEKRMDPLESHDTINQLVALGYIEKPDENREKAVAQTARELDYNLARSYMDAGFYSQAAAILERLLDQWPDEYRFGIQLVNCYLTAQRINDARRVLEQTLKRKNENAASAQEKLKAFHEKHKGVKPSDLTEAQKRELEQIRTEVSLNPYAVAYLKGSLALAQGDEEGALTHLEAAEEVDSGQPVLFIKLGDVYVRMKQWEPAERCFQKALNLDPDNAEAYLGLCRTLLPRRRNREASEAALSSIGLVYHNPRAHFLLGVSLHRLGEISLAIKALKVALSQNPFFPEAHRRLAYIYKRRLKNTTKALAHRQLANEAAKRLRELKAERKTMHQPAGKKQTPVPYESRKVSRPPEDPSQTIVIVTGLPRSGTSMIMQMLKAGGLALLTDEKRTADEDNPKGYFEYEPVKGIQRDRTWLPRAKGKAVKLVAPLLKYLPNGFSYRIIFMHRNLDEVIASQNKLIERRPDAHASADRERLVYLFEKELVSAENVLKQRDIATLHLEHGKTIEDPANTSAELRNFLNYGLKEKEMAKVIDPRLYRRRA